ncbi:hypothetical protein OAD33_06980 [Alphaproteobacteria bacterium]|nr:hypothetical protein [Alphaproteobacteria bacterium]
MSKEFIHVIFLVSFFDLKPCEMEKDWLNNFRKNFPSLKKFTDEEFKQEVEYILKKIDAEMKVDYIINDIGNVLDQDAKNIAFAIAAEVCASNFEIATHEKALLKKMLDIWNINNSVKDSIYTSIKLRYGITY